MHKRMTITLDTCLDDGYRAMAADAARELEAHEWCNALAKDMQAIEDAIRIHLGLARV